MTEPRYSARDLASLLGRESPTDEQVAVIEAPLEGVYRVVAGAGSGKTETMALRVVWLVANGYVAAHHVLGLTFTRKAAGELGQRIAQRIRALPGAKDAETDIFQMPQVSTYNSFASRLFQDYAVYLGVDSDQEVAGQAAAWSLARRIVSRSTLAGLEQLDYSVDRLTGLVWQFAGAIAENDVNVHSLVAHAESMASLGELPLGSRYSYDADMAQILESQQLIPLLVELVTEFQAEKRSRGMVEYSDQVRLALEVARRAPDVVSQMRERYRVVLLDEYQDTSVLQTQLLSTLFADHPVMSVGDPNQAIYGWRGASAGNLADFDTAFRKSLPGRTFGLTTSWRNPASVLRAANTIAHPLMEHNRFDVGPLSPAPGAGEGELAVAIAHTVADEAETVAEWFASALASGETPSAALLVRQRTHQQLFASALRRRGIPVHILGIGGLLSDPVVADIVCGLAVVHRSHANQELVRLLTSGRFRLGVADLDRLARVAKWLVTRDATGKSLDDSLHEALTDQALGTPSASLTDALDYLARSTGDQSRWQGFSESGASQLRECAALLDAARRLGHEPLLDQVSFFERHTLLDIEAASNPQREQSAEAREALVDAIRQYQAFADDTGAAGFLDWLEQAEWRDSLTPRSEPAEPGCVQILTIHGAKGLEWDLVAVVRMVDDELPGKSREGTSGWLSPGVLPYPFRGDANYLPRFDHAGAESRKELIDRYKRFKQDVAAHHLLEERRLAYVAMTRAKKSLMLSASYWSTQQKPRNPSVFLRELAEEGLIPELSEAPGVDERPDVEPEMLTWPGDPLGGRREVVERAADAVSRAIDNALGPAEADRDLIDRVLAEEQAKSAPVTPRWPVRIPASQFDRWIHEPETMLASRMQPRPGTVGVAQQRGNVFHEWVEGFFHEAGHGRLLADVDPDTPGVVDDVDIERWQETFQRSRYAALRPLALEREIHYPLAGHLIICKIDAVFDDGGRTLIVDWKTGRAPQSDDEVARKGLQLALYRLAWADWSDTPLEQVDAALWFSDTDTTIQPATLPGASELTSMLEQAKRRTG